MDGNACELVIGGVNCDAPGCDYRDESADLQNYEKFLNVPCPKCGSILLTEKDWALVKLMQSGVDFANVMVGPVPAESERVLIPLEMNGTGDLAIMDRKELDRG